MFRRSLVVTRGGYSVKYSTITTSVSLKPLGNNIVSIHDFPTAKIAVVLGKKKLINSNVNCIEYNNINNNSSNSNSY